VLNKILSNEIDGAKKMLCVRTEVLRANHHHAIFFKMREIADLWKDERVDMIHRSVCKDERADMI
jgi:hypothetical protein